MNKIIIETNKSIFREIKPHRLNPMKLIEQFSRTIATRDWEFLCRRKDFLDAVDNKDYNKVKEIARDNLVTR